MKRKKEPGGPRFLTGRRGGGGGRERCYAEGSQTSSARRSVQLPLPAEKKEETVFQTDLSNTKERKDIMSGLPARREERKEKSWYQAGEGEGDVSDALRASMRRATLRK